MHAARLLLHIYLLIENLFAGGPPPAPDPRAHIHHAEIYRVAGPGYIAASYPLGCRVPRAGADYPRRTGDVAEGDAAVMADRKLAVAVV